MTNTRFIISRNKREGGYVGNTFGRERVRAGFIRRKIVDIGALINYPETKIPRMTLRRWSKIKKQWMGFGKVNKAI